MRQTLPRNVSRSTGSPVIDDMVKAQHGLLTQCLNVDHLRLVMGTSMGGMLGMMLAALPGSP